jgi:hypothetical protein
MCSSLQIYIQLEEASEAARNAGMANVKVLTVIL